MRRIPNPHLQQADLVIVINSGVPWMPRISKPKASSKVIHMGIDPLVSRHPFREYEADLLVAGDPVAGLVMLNEALGKRQQRRPRRPPQDRRCGARGDEGRARQACSTGQERACRFIRRGSPTASTRRSRRTRSSSTSSASRRGVSTSIKPLQLHRHVARRRARRRTRHGVGRKARRARPRSHRRRRRRVLHVRQSGAVSFRAAVGEIADAHDRREQPPMARREAIDACRLS